jgi:predicted dehydrogenase/nucleoside-diphosphate-sugar epimerase
MQNESLYAAAGSVEAPIRVGIIGCGRVAQHHIKFLSQLQGVEITALADDNLEKARKLGEKYAVPNIFPSLEKLLSECPVDSAHVLSPPKYHFEHALKCIERGVHAFIEKPISQSFDEARKIYSLAEKKNVKVLPDFIHLFNPLFTEALTSIEANRLGALVHAECYMGVERDPGVDESVGLHWSYEMPGGIMHNYITHPVYLVLYWTGRAKSMEVLPRSFGTLPQGLTDHLDALIEGEKATGKITVSMASKHPNYYLKLFFAHGTVMIDFVTQTFTIEKPNGLPRAANRMFLNFTRSRQLMGGSILNAMRFLRKKIVPYQGLKHLALSYYEWIRKGGPAPISEELSLEVSRVEDLILKKAGKVHFDSRPKPSRQTAASRGKKILLTGGTGYLGSEVLRKLVEKGYYVRAYVRKSSRTDLLDALGVEIIYGDIRELEALKKAALGMDAIIHIAAALKGSRDFMLDCAVNGTGNVARAAKEANLERVIYISSFSVYDYLCARDGSTLTEESPLEAHGEERGLYSWAKRQAEDIALENLSSGGAPAWTVLRPSLLFGKRGDLASLIGPRIGNFVISFGRGSKRLKLVHVTDAADAVLRSLEKESAANRVFNLSHEDNITVKELLNFLNSHGREKLRVIHIPYSAGLALVVALKIMKKILRRGPAFGRVRLAYLSRDLAADTRAFRDAAGWRPSATLIHQLKEEAKGTAGRKELQTGWESETAPKLKQARAS